MEEMIRIGWTTENSEGDIGRSVIFLSKDEALAHCTELNKIKELGPLRPYKPVEVFKKAKP